MPGWIYIGSVGLTVLILIMTVLLWRRVGGGAGSWSAAQMERLEQAQAETARILRDELSRLRTENLQTAKDLRMELQDNMRHFSQELFERLREHFDGHRSRLDDFARQVKGLQEETGRQLEQMRYLVDEKLQSTLEKRLGESFQLVGNQLEKVHQGLGEMQSLAVGVGDLKKVLSNVKSRGYFGEGQAETILADILTREQYGKNVAVKKGSDERVEFAVKLPGRGDTKDEVVWLPIDAKFPLEDYHRLLEAHEKSEPKLLEEAHQKLAQRVKGQAKDIHDKYLDPPRTTDFAIMFLPTESLFAEVMRIPGLFEELQRTYRVSVTGPTTLAALLNSLSMGFRTLAIEKRSSEVWKLLSAVKTEFGKFGELLAKTSKKIQEAGNQLDLAAAKTRTIERKLRGVEQLPAGEAVELLGPSEELSDSDTEEPN